MEGDKRKILWADDEIDLLRAHRRFLDERGYAVTPVSNGKDAIALIAQAPFDIVLLDEMMPGLDGLSTLEQIKTADPNVPVIMITKNEEEHLMDEAIGRRIDNYLTKPVNPSQIFMACKQLLDARQIRQSQAGQHYVSRAGQIREQIAGATWQTWIDVHRQLCEWDIEVARLGDVGLGQMVGDQRRECNREFGRFVEQQYTRWVADEGDSPPLSVDVVPEFVVPYLEQGQQVFFIVVDCLRLDHWMVMEPQLAEYFNIKRSYHYSILPTATPFARNAIFSGLFPKEIADKYRTKWGEGPRQRIQPQSARASIYRRLGPRHGRCAQAGFALRQGARHQRGAEIDPQDTIAGQVAACVGSVQFSRHAGTQPSAVGLAQGDGTERSGLSRLGADVVWQCVAL